jgi:hypothetical protein
MRRAAQSRRSRGPRWGRSGDRPSLYRCRLPGGSLPTSRPRTTRTARRRHPPLPTRGADPHGMPGPRAPLSRESRPRLRLLPPGPALRTGPESAGTGDSRRPDPHPRRRRDRGDLARRRHAHRRTTRPAPSRRPPCGMTAQIEPVQNRNRRWPYPNDVPPAPTPDPGAPNGKPGGPTWYRSRSTANPISCREDWYAPTPPASYAPGNDRADLRHEISVLRRQTSRPPPGLARSSRCPSSDSPPTSPRMLPGFWPVLVWHATPSAVSCSPRVAGGHAGLVGGPAQGGARNRLRLGGRRFPAGPAVHLPVRGAARRPACEPPVWAGGGPIRWPRWPSLRSR